MYYPYSENKGADQLRSYREADLRLCFHMQIVGFFMRQLIWSCTQFGWLSLDNISRLIIIVLILIYMLTGNKST